MKIKLLFLSSVFAVFFFQFPVFSETSEFRVHKDVPPFQFMFIKNGKVIQKIEVYQKNRLVQTVAFDGSDLTEGQLENPLDLIKMEDYNFDGYLDIAVLKLLGASNARWDILIYNPKNNLFSFNKELSDLANPYPDQGKKLVFSHEKGGYAGLIYSDKVYKLEKGKFVLVKTDEQDLYGEEKTEEGQKFKRTIREAVKGKLIVACEFIVIYADNGRPSVVKILKGSKSQVKAYLKES